jgi:DNA polymerase-1
MSSPTPPLSSPPAASPTQEPAQRERVFLIDAHSLIFQVFHAIAPMTSPSGLPTNALFGFTRDLLYLRNQKPDYLICVFDVAGPTFREKLYPEYKANRGAMPDDLSIQLPLIRQCLEALRIPVLGVTGFEADDVIATVAKKAAARGLYVYLCTSDKDCRQLLDDRVHMYNLRKRIEFDPAALLADWGVRPEQVVDFQTLVGDAVDNVPGVKGVGPKTATKLLQEFGTLDNLLKNLDKVKGKLKENLQAAVPTLPLSRRLVELDVNVPLEMTWDAWRLRDWDAAKCAELFQQWGFRTFAEAARADLKREPAAPARAGSDPSEVRQREMFPEEELFPFGANAPGGDGAAAATPAAPAWQATYHLVETPQKFQGFLRRLSKQKRIAVDLETTGLDPLRCQIVGYAFCWGPGEAWYLPVRAPAGEKHLDPDKTLEKLRPVLEDATVAKLNQNIKYDLLVLRKHGVRLANVVGDPMVADYLLHAGERSHNLEELARRYFSYQVTPISDLIGKGKTQTTIDQVPTARVAQYSGEDADVAWRLHERLEPDLAAAGMSGLYADLEVPLIDVLAELEYNGIRLDVPLLARLGEQMGQQLEAIENQIYASAGHPFNIASPKQLRQVLFQELKLKPQRKTGTTGEPSTDQETLEKLAGDHPLPRKILEYRGLAKLKGTYIDALPDLVNPDTGRLHASFNQTVTSTGRLSSSDPNLQNIPVRRDQGRQIRQAFLPQEGWSLLTADYSQIELRLLAHFCGDETLRRAFAEDRDIHAAVAAQIYGVTEEQVTPEMRRVAKTVNFGVIYGISAVGLAVRLDMKPEDGARFIDAYFARYPRVLEYQARLLENCHRTGWVGTILGRRRRIEGVRLDSTYKTRNQPEREAINCEIQGSAADLMKLAMLNVHRRLRAERRQTRMLLQIHDELVFEVPPEEFEPVAALVREEMTAPVARALRLEVPLKVDLSAGPNWLDVQELATKT